MSQQIELIIFDFDGVLREVSWNHIYESYRKVIKIIGKEPELFFADLSSFKKWNNPDWHKNEARIFGDDKRVDSKKFSELFHSFYEKDAPLFSWADYILEILAKEHKLAIVSSSDRKSVGKKLGESVKYFSSIVGGFDVVNLKPDPEGILRVLAESGMSNEQTVMIGDMSVDFFAGKRAGVKTGVVKWGLGNWDELCSLDADFVFEKPEEFLLKL